MPAPLGFKIHRLHVMLDADDYQWLCQKQRLNGDRSISDTFRKILRQMRGLSLENPKLSVIDLIRNTETK